MGKIDEWVNEVAKEINLYRKNISDEVYEVAQEVGKDTVKMLKDKNTGGYEDHRKKYRKSFRYKIQKDYSSIHLKVYSTEPQLTHLLEDGHIILNSGKGMNKHKRTRSGKTRYFSRITGGTERTRSFPHWKAAEEYAVKEFDKRLKKRLEGIEL